jgi:hypothetical protein
MPRKAQLFDSCAGSPVGGFLRLQGNIPPRWIENARTSRKLVEPSLNIGLRKLHSLRKNHPRAKARIREANKLLKVLLQQWEVKYQKENFYRGTRILLEIQRAGSSIL